MDRSSPSHHTTSRAERQLAHLKILSRLLGHELHAQSSPRITLSRDEVEEIQASLDMYIEEVMRSKGHGVGTPTVVASELEVQAVPARVN